MKLRVLLSTVAVVLLAVFFSQAQNDSDVVEVAALSHANWDDFAPQGKEVDAIYGDIVLRNKHLTAVIAKPVATRNANMTVKTIAGALIDLTTRDQPSDQLSAFYPGKRAYPFRSWSAADADGNPIDVDSKTSGQAASVTVTAAAGGTRPRVEVTYALKANAKALELTTKYTNESNAPITVQLVDDIRADSGKEDMPKAPNGTADLYWMHDRFWGQAYGVSGDGLEITSQSNSRTSTLTYRPANGTNKVDIAPGKSFSFTRRVFPASNLIDIKAIHAEQNGTKTFPAEFVVSGAIDQPAAGGLVSVYRGGKLVGSGRASETGRFTCNLPAGEYTVQTAVDSVNLFAKDAIRVSVVGKEKANKFQLKSSTYFTGDVVAQIKGGDGKPVPCKVDFLAKDGTPQPDFGPETAEFAVKSLRYTVDGKFRQTLPAGTYDVIISRGPEYDAVFEELTVLAGQTVSLRATLNRVVQTPGWVSSDFHSHSSPSGDNTGSQFGRVLNLVCEHVEFAPCTEHNRVSTYDPHIKRLGIGHLISTVSGMDLTGSPLPLNHQNVFPMVHQFGLQDGGGPVTDSSVETQIERIAFWDRRSEKLVQQNHPDPGWLFYDKNGDGKPDGGHERAFQYMDVMEIHPIEAVLSLGLNYKYPNGRPFHNRIFNWLQMLNQGFRIFGVVNTDAHYNFHGSSSVRNWIQSSTDDPAKIDPKEMVHASEQGRLVMSNGPYLEVSLTEVGQSNAAVSGQDIEAPSGKVTVSVRVQAPNWVEVDRVFVLVNGRVVEAHNYSKTANPDRFQSGVVRFEGQLELDLTEDSHVIVACGSDKPLGPKVVGPMWGTYRAAAITNPIFVDIDSDGFKPNKDTLGHPLPVKFGTRKQ